MMITLKSRYKHRTIYVELYCRLHILAFAFHFFLPTISIYIYMEREYYIIYIYFRTHCLAVSSVFDSMGIYSSQRRYSFSCLYQSYTSKTNQFTGEFQMCLSLSSIFFLLWRIFTCVLLPISLFHGFFRS